MKDLLEHIDEVIHQKTRLGILSMLAAQEDIEFSELKNRLGLTDGNLSSHIALLEKNGLVSVKKSFVRKKPKTNILISAAGRTALQNYLELLRKIIES